MEWSAPETAEELRRWLELHAEATGFLEPDGPSSPWAIAGLLVQAVTAATESKAVEELLRSVGDLERRFPKEAELARAREALAQLGGDETAAASIAAWREWLELERARPALFPALAGKDETKFAKRLEAHVRKHDEGPGSAQCKAWLEAFATAKPKRQP